MAFADVKYECLQMLDGLVSTHPTQTVYLSSGKYEELFQNINLIVILCYNGCKLHM